MSAIVRVRILSEQNRSVESAAVLNGGFSTSIPHILLPAKVALLLWPDYPAATSPVGARTAGGQVSLRGVTGSVQVQVLTDDRAGPSTPCAVLVSDQEDEILLSDYAIDALDVRIERHGPGEWRFADETRARPSVPRQRW